MFVFMFTFISAPDDFTHVPCNFVANESNYGSYKGRAAYVSGATEKEVGKIPGNGSQLSLQSNKCAHAQAKTERQALVFAWLLFISP